MDKPRLLSDLTAMKTTPMEIKVKSDKEKIYRE